MMLLVIGVIAAVLSIFHADSVFNLVSLAWGENGGGFRASNHSGPVLAAVQLLGALTSIVLGILVATLGWQLPLDADATAPAQFLSGLWGVMRDNPAGMWNIQPAPPGFLIATPVAVLATLLTPAPSQAVTEVFDLVNGPPPEAP